MFDDFFKACTQACFKVLFYRESNLYKKNNIIFFISGRERAAYEEEHREVRCTGLCHHSKASEHKGEKTISHITTHRRRR